MKHALAIFMILVLLAGCLAFITPFVANNMRDFGDIWGWVHKDQEGKEVPSATYDGDKGKNHLEEFYKLVDSPVRPNQLSLILFAVVCGLIFTLYSLSMRRDPYDWFLQTVLPAQLICVAILIVYLVIDYQYFDLGERLSSSKDAVVAYQTYTIFVGVIFKIIELFVVDFIIFVIADLVVNKLELQEKYVARETAGLLGRAGHRLDQEQLIVSNDGYAVLSVIKMQSIIPVATITGRANLSKLFGFILGDNSARAFSDLTVRLKAACRGFSSTAGQATLTQAAAVLGEFLHSATLKSLQTLGKPVPEGEKVVPYQAARELLQTVSDGNLRRYQQEITAKLIEHFSTKLRQAYTRLRQDAAGSHDGVSLQEELLVPGTRYITRQGNRTVVVVEQHPQARTLAFSDDIIDKFIPNADNSMRQCEFLLALPYVVFVICLWGEDGGIRVSAFGRKDPLSSLSDPVSLLGLPNINVDGSVCLGGDFSDPGRNQDRAVGLRERVEAVLNHFWFSVFNIDYDERLAAFLRLNPGLSLVEWANRTSQDSMAGLNFLYPPSNDRRSVLEQITSLRNDASGSSQERSVINQIVDSSANDARLAVLGAMVEFSDDSRPYSNATAKELETALRGMAKTIAKNATVELAALIGDNQQLADLLQSAVDNTIAQVLDASLPDICAAATLYPQADAAAVFERMRDSW